MAIRTCAKLLKSSKILWPGLWINVFWTTKISKVGSHLVPLIMQLKAVFIFSKNIYFSIVEIVRRNMKNTHLKPYKRP